jgi:hypothetical protein
VAAADPAVVLAERMQLASPMATCLLAGVLGILQDMPYEWVNARAGVRAVYLNEETFELGDLSERLNHGSATVILSFTLCCMAFALAHDLLRRPAASRRVPGVLVPVATGLLAGGLACALQFPFQAVKYLGCTDASHALLRLARMDLYRFHASCLQSSRVSASACLALLAAGSLAGILRGCRAREGSGAAAAGAGSELWLSMLGCHGVFLFLLCCADRWDLSGAVFLVANCVAHLSLARFAGSSGLSPKAV